MTIPETLQCIDRPVTVANTSTELVAANPRRQYLCIINDSDETMYLRYHGNAILNRGFRLNSAGGSFEINVNNMFKGKIDAICTSGGKIALVNEVSFNA